MPRLKGIDVGVGEAVVMGDFERHVQVIVPRSALTELEDAVDLQLGEPALKQPDGGLADAGFIEFVVIGLVGLASAVVGHLFRLHERNTDSGVVLDLGADPPTISYVARVPHGTLIVREPGRPAQVHSLQGKEPVEIQRLFDVLLASVGS